MTDVTGVDGQLAYTPVGALKVRTVYQALKTIHQGVTTDLVPTKGKSTLHKPLTGKVSEDLL